MTNQIPDPSAPRLLQRRRSDRHLAGVAGGVADYLNVSATAVRVAFVLASLAGGAGIVAYLVGVALIPVAGESDSLGLRMVGGRRDLLLGLCIVTAALLLAAFSLGDLDTAVIILLLVGGAVMWARSNSTASPRPLATPQAWGPPTPMSTWPQRSVVTAEPGPAPAAPARRKRGSAQAVCIVLAATVLAALVTGPYTGVVAVVGTMLVVLVLGMTVIALSGRNPWALLAPLLVLALLFPVAKIFDDSGAGIRDGFGEVHLVASDLTVGRPERLAAGEMTLDLSELRSPGIYTATIGAGHLLVTLPTDVTVRVFARVGAGELTVTNVSGRSESKMDSMWSIGGPSTERVQASSSSTFVSGSVNSNSSAKPPLRP